MYLSTPSQMKFTTLVTSFLVLGPALALAAPAEGGNGSDGGKTSEEQQEQPLGGGQPTRFRLGTGSTDHHCKHGKHQYDVDSSKDRWTPAVDTHSFRPTIDAYIYSDEACTVGRTFVKAAHCGKIKKGNAGESTTVRCVTRK